MVTFIGDDFLARDESGLYKVCIATIFPGADVIVTFPYTHAEQRNTFVDFLNRQRAETGKPPLTQAEEYAEIMAGVDLYPKNHAILIRPDPSQMDLAFAADEILRTVPSSGRPVQFMYLSDARVRDALKRRGECWRIFQPPTEPRKIRQTVADAKSAIHGRPIYYHSPSTGTRWLTLQSLHELGELDPGELHRHLEEIAAYSAKKNMKRHHEVAFFQFNKGISASDIEAVVNCPPDELAMRFKALCNQCRTDVSPTFQRDNFDDAAWIKAMFDLLLCPRGDNPVDDNTIGLDPDFSMRVEWLPGGRIEKGELILDPALHGREVRTGVDHVPAAQNQIPEVENIVHRLILNLVQEYGNLEYINVGSVLPSPSRNLSRGGRREVYVVQIKQRRVNAEVLQIVRMQKWGVRERLDEQAGKDIEHAMFETDEYTQYIFDRRLACQQLRMNIPHRLTTRKVSEKYFGKQSRYWGRQIWTPYFQRDYIPGVGTDRLPNWKLEDRAYAIIFARLFGQAAASNIILGRAEIPLPGAKHGPIVFDVGDEILVDDCNGTPTEIVVSDHVGAFVDYEGTLESRTSEYAGPVIKRLEHVSHPHEFIEAYISGFTECFLGLQVEYSRHKAAFDTLFKHHQPEDHKGSLSWRWSCVLDRMHHANPGDLSELIREAISKAT